MTKKRKRITSKKTFLHTISGLPVYIKILMGLVLFLIIITIPSAVRFAGSKSNSQDYIEFNSDAIDASKPEIEVKLLTPNPYSRPGTETGKINSIVIHYVANPGSTAMANRNYFEDLKDSHTTKASSNFIIGLEGEIIQCVPTWEVAYASNNRNTDSVSIECCHPDETGKFTTKTYQSMVHLTAWLCLKFDLTETDIIRHYDITGKNCPKYFVENEDAWEKFRADVKEVMSKGE